MKKNELDFSVPNLGKCTICKFIYCLTHFTQNDFIKVYDELYNREGSQYQRHSKNEFDRIISKKTIKVGWNRSQLIKRNVLNAKCKSVLEIGSGIGLVGTYIRSKDNLIQYVGVELDKEAYEKSQLLGLNTINGDFKEIKNIENQFDVIMMWEVIEHLQDLNLFLELAYEKLNVNGKIILSTPNYNKIYNYPKREKGQTSKEEYQLNHKRHLKLGEILKNTRICSSTWFEFGKSDYVQKH